MLPVIAAMAVIPWFLLTPIPEMLGGPKWWKVPLALLLAYPFLLAMVIGLNSLFRYRVEVRPEGLLIAGNFYSHDLRWDEITSIHARPNHRAPGWHVGIFVDGSNNPRRHWCNLWFAGYYIHPLMEHGGKDLVRYLNARRREWARRQSPAETA